MRQLRLNLEGAAFNRFEIPVVGALQRYLGDEASGPLLTNNEDDLILPEDDTHFFETVAQGAVPADAPQRLREGGLTRDTLIRNMRVRRNVVRKEKAEMFADRFRAATFATDTCRSLMWIATRGEFIPVKVDDTPETVRLRVGDYVSDLLTAGRERRVLRNAAMDRLTKSIREKFDTDPVAASSLTVLAGVNSRKKVGFFLDEMFKTSKGFERLNKQTKVDIRNYLAERPPQFQQELDLYALMAEQARQNPNLQNKQFSIG